MFQIIRPSGNISIETPNLKYIYKIKHTESSKTYIGQTNNPERRIGEHLSGSGSKPLLQDLVEYGRQAFTFEIIDCCHADRANDLEDEYITRFDCITSGYNLRINATIRANGNIIDPDNIQLSAKYVFTRGNSRVFTIGATTQHNSYQLLKNLEAQSGFLIQEKNNFGFSYLEIEVSTSEPYEPKQTYELNLRLDSDGKFIIP